MCKFLISYHHSLPPFLRAYDPYLHLPAGSHQQNWQLPLFIELRKLVLTYFMSDVESHTQSEDSVALAAAIERGQQYRADLQRFSDHLSILEDLFFFDDRRHADLFNLSCRLLAPVVPFSDLEQEAAQNRFVRLVKSFEESCQEEFARFEEETEEVRKLYRSLISAEERRWNEKEAQRQDSFAALSQLCRREVSALVARVRADTAQSTTEIEAMEVLKVSLEAKCNEVDALRAHVQQLVLSHEADRKQWLDDIAKERDTSRALVQEGREKFTQQLQTQIKQAEIDRTSYHDELTQQHKSYSDQIAAMRHKLVEQQSESEKLRRKMDEVSIEHGRELRFHAEEKNRLTRMITDLEISYETLKRNIHEVETDAKLNQMNLEHMTETKKLLEIQSFKKRLADTTTLLASGARASPSTFSSPRGTTPRWSHVDVSSPGAYQRNTSVATTSDAASVPPPYRESSVSILKSLSSPPYRDRSKSPNNAMSATAQLQRPSDTYVRLSNLNRQMSASAVRASSSPYPPAS